MDLAAHLCRKKALIDAALTRYLPSGRARPGVLHRAMRYACFPGGKRIRPVLLLESAALLGVKETAALPAACAVELVHSYSLVHDDLPALDDDDWRRGWPSCHRRFGEAVALLAGDALLTLSFQLLAEELRRNFPERICLEVAAELAGAAGSRGMVGGQAAELEAGAAVTPEVLEYVHRHKTAALIAAAVKMGARLGKASGAEFAALAKFGLKTGLAFQAADDLLDGDGIVGILGKEAVRERARRLAGEARRELKRFGKKAADLAAIADFIVERKK